jgi:hypothetical protein
MRGGGIADAVQTTLKRGTNSGASEEDDFNLVARIFLLIIPCNQLIIIMH